MVNKSGRIGTSAETAVVNYLIANGFPNAERRRLRGRLDCGDITGTPGVVWEVKGGQAARSASDRMITGWLAETERERLNAGVDQAVLVVQRTGVGAPNAGLWWAIFTHLAYLYLANGGHFSVDAPMPTETHVVRVQLADAVTLLRSAGYGAPLKETPHADA